MNQDIFWTASFARLQRIRNQGEQYNWLFLPGGPGLGSESLRGLTDILNLPGTMWYLDLPEDGSNDKGDFSDWAAALTEATSALENVILVAHSSGGMFALATPDLELNLRGLVLMDSAPDSGWQQYFVEHMLSHPLPQLEALQKKYVASPSNETLKELTIASVPYFSTPKSADILVRMLHDLPVNYKTQMWAEENFDPIYQAQWIPQQIPTLIFAGVEDTITPLKLFAELPEFQRPNIVLTQIGDAAHFPWVENPEAVKQAFAAYCERLEA